MVQEHRIRLRGGWECETIDRPEASPRRLALPTRWPPGAGRLRLTRRFGRPPVEAGRRVVLRLEHTPGLQALELDGLPVAPVSSGRSEYEIPLDASTLRHQLVLVVDTSEPGDPSGTAPDWGHIFLVIRLGGPPDVIEAPG